MNALDTARGPRRATPPGALDAVLRDGARRYRRRQVVTGAALTLVAGVTGVGVAAPSVVVSVANSLGDVIPYVGDSGFEGEEWVRSRLPYDDVTDDVRPGFCDEQPGSVANGWCATLTATPVVDPGGTATLTYRLCRDSTAKVATVTWPDFGEVDFHVVGQRGEDWYWRTAQPAGVLNRAGHDVTFTPGRCRAWTVRWAATFDGKPALDGGYDVVAHADPDEVSRGERPPPAVAELRVR
jgi:hypothetical protein